MAVYVDPLVDWGMVARARGLRHTVWCHLTADTPEELHAFAARLGLRRSSLPDYLKASENVAIEALEADPFAAAVVAFVETHGPFSGSVTQLLNLLPPPESHPPEVAQDRLPRQQPTAALRPRTAHLRHRLRGEPVHGPEPLEVRLPGIVTRDCPQIAVRSVRAVRNTT